MANSIKVTVVAKNGLAYFDCPKTIHLPCPSGTVVDGQDYYVTSDEGQNGWKFDLATVAPASPILSFPVAKVNVGLNEYLVTGVNTSTPLHQQIADACNTCCGPTEPVIPPGTIPTLNAVSEGQSVQNCEDGTCTYTYQDRLPTDASKKEYSLQFICGDVVLTSGATVFGGPVAGGNQAALNYANANWASYATFTLGTAVDAFGVPTDSTVLYATGATCSAGVLKHTLVNQVSTLNMTAGNVINQINVDGYITTIPTSHTYAETPDGRTALVAYLAPYIGGGTLAVGLDAVYTGTAVPLSVLLNGVVVQLWTLA